MIPTFPQQNALRKGMKDGIPIGLAYLAVGFTIGITCKQVGFSALQGFLLSLFNLASAGEYADLTVIAADAAYFEIILVTLVANARYLLMGAALSQKIAPDTPFCRRLLMAYGITDEIFAISVTQPGYVNPLYEFGAILVASPSWALGTAAGVLIGNVLPEAVLSALSFAIVGRFIALIIGPIRSEKPVGICVGLGFLCSYLLTNWPVTADLSDGTRTILLTVVIAALAAVLFPVKEEQEGGAR